MINLILIWLLLYFIVMPLSIGIIFCPVFNWENIKKIYWVIFNSKNDD